MSKKLEKLKEINAIINRLLIDLETKLFIDNMNYGDKKINNENSVVNVGSKQ